MIVKGLKSKESEKFNRYFALIQKAASELNSVFYAHAGDGNDFETDELEGEEVMGWLIPADKSEEFEPIWAENESLLDEDWTEYFVWAVWEIVDGKLIISFKD